VRVLDLFAGEGGAGTGYSWAGFTIYAVDNDPARLANNPHPSHLGDVFDVLETLLNGGAVTFTHKDGRAEDLKLGDFSAAHGSPTCTGYSRGTVALPNRLERYDRLIAATRAGLQATGLPYIIENVEDAGDELRNPLMLCGSEFGLGAIDTDGTRLRLERHRLFESNIFLYGAGGCEGLHSGPRDRTQTAGAYGGARRDKTEAREIRKGGYVPKDLDVLRTMLGTPWMTEKGCFLSIPPAYTEFIGQQLMTHILEVAA